MTCQEAEKHIYLYPELTPGERDATDRHIDTCAACRQLLDAATAERNTCVASAQVRHELPDASRMTRRIMDAVSESQRRKASWFTFRAGRPSLNVLRYAMVVVSLSLVLLFVTEYVGEKPIAPYKVIAIADPAELNTTAFHAAFVSSKEEAKSTTTSFYAYVAHCQTADSVDCDAWKTKYHKP